MDAIVLFFFGVLAAIIAYYVFEYFRSREKKKRMKAALRSEVQGHASVLANELDHHLPDWEQQNFTQDISRELCVIEVYDTYKPLLIDLLSSRQLEQLLYHYQIVQRINFWKHKGIDPNDRNTEVPQYLRQIARSLTFALGTFLFLDGKRENIVAWEWITERLQKYGHTNVKDNLIRRERYFFGSKLLKRAAIGLTLLQVLLVIVATVTLPFEYLQGVLHFAQKAVIPGFSLLAVALVCYLLSYLLERIVFHP